MIPIRFHRARRRPLLTFLSAFAAFDGQVHDAAVSLGDVALTADYATLTMAYQRIQDGCVACHTTFRSRVSEALAAVRR